MRRFLALLAVVLFTGVVCSQAEDAPSLLGKWSSRYKVSFLSGVANSDGSFVITKQTGPDFSGYLVWKNLDSGRTGKEAFTGTFDYDGKCFVMAQEDGGSVKGKLIGANKMQVLVWQSASKKGVTLTFRGTFTRQMWDW